ncbi:DNA methyltransferase, partial [Thermus scotoductus]|uniref:DNA methyltransferase n=1 Tax=Thermus scotoductus TaxID=37636 RepID=UPI001002E668
ILQIATNPHDGDIVLDSFAGSGPTGHAVLKQNAADCGNRRFILVELDPHIAQNITRRRLEYAAREHGSGFQYPRLGETLFTPDGRIRECVVYLTLPRSVYYRETGEPLPSTNRPPLLGVSHPGHLANPPYHSVLKERPPKSHNSL